LEPDHVGEVIVYTNGVAVNIGKCKVCGGTGKGDLQCLQWNGKANLPGLQRNEVCSARLDAHK